MADDAQLFRIAVAIAALVAAFFPGSPISRLLLKRRGPAPGHHETHYHFSFRWAWFAFAWFVVLAAADILGMYCYEASIDSEAAWAMATFVFALPLLAALALVGSVLHAIRGLWQFAFHRNARFSLEVS